MSYYEVADPDKLHVAATILAQLGGKRFLVMTGCRPVGCAGGTEQDPLPYLKLLLPTGNLVRHGHTHMLIYLQPNDLYKVESFRHTLDLFGEKQNLVEHPSVYAEDLARVFTSITGLDTHL